MAAQSKQQEASQSCRVDAHAHSAATSLWAKALRRKAEEYVLIGRTERGTTALMVVGDREGSHRRNKRADLTGLGFLQMSRQIWHSDDVLFGEWADRVLGGRTGRVPTAECGSWVKCEVHFIALSRMIGAMQRSESPQVSSFGLSQFLSLRRNPQRSHWLPGSQRHFALPPSESSPDL